MHHRRPAERPAASEQKAATVFVDKHPRRLGFVTVGVISPVYGVRTAMGYYLGIVSSEIGRHALTRYPNSHGARGMSSTREMSWAAPGCRGGKGGLDGCGGQDLFEDHDGGAGHSG
jgi:hypothetical protein